MSEDTVAISAKEYEALAKLQKTVLRNIGAFSDGFSKRSTAPNLTLEQAQSADNILQSARAVGKACKPPTWEERALEVCRELAHWQESGRRLPEIVADAYSVIEEADKQ